MKKIIVAVLSIMMVFLIISISTIKAYCEDETPFTGQSGSPSDFSLDAI